MMSDEIDEYRIERLEIAVEKLSVQVDKLDQIVARVGLEHRFFEVLVPVFLFIIGLLAGKILL